tara:strand:- start:1483 stop:1746 length:264 start_codon:yes stop_codon:yes gene_type:complete
MEKNDNYFDSKSEAEKLRNLSSLVNDIVNAKPDPSLEVQESETPETEIEEVPEVNPVVDLVGKAISTHNPKGMFMHGVQVDGSPTKS